MAHRRKKRRKRRVGAVSTIGRRRSPKRRKRRVSGVSTIGKRGGHRRKRRSVSGPHRKRGHRRRRMGAPGGAVAEYFGTLFGVGVGLFTGEVGGGAIVRMAGGPTTGAIIGTAIGKIAASVGTFALGEGPLKKNAFVKGVGIGLGGSAINDGFRAMQSQGMISGPPMMSIIIKDGSGANNGGGKLRQLTPGVNSPTVSGPGVIGDPGDYTDAICVNY